MKNYKEDLSTIQNFFNVDILEAQDLYSKLRKQYGELEWLTLNDTQKLNRMKEYDLNFLSF